MVLTINRQKLYDIILKIIKYIAILITIIGIIIATSFILNYTGILSSTNIIKKGSENNSHRYSNQTRSNRYQRLKSALSIIEHINENINPCDNFYEFACGRLINSSQQLKNHPRINTITQARIAIYHELDKNINEIDEKCNLKPFQLIRTLYNTCRNNDIIEKNGLRPLMKILEKFGGWPILKRNGWNDTSFTWERMFYDIYELGLPAGSIYFMRIQMGRNLNNHRNSIVKLMTPNVEYSEHKFLSNNIDIRLYISYMVHISRMLGNKSDEEKQVIAVFEDLVRFEYELSKLGKFHSHGTRYGSTINELKKNWPTIDWNTLLQKTMLLNDDIRVIMDDRRFILLLEKLLLNTPKYIQQNYVLWKVIKFSIPYLNQKIQKLDSSYNIITRRKSNSNSDWLKCVLVVKNELQLTTDALYVRKNLKPSIKQHVNEMVNNIQNRMVDVLSKIEWFDNQTRDNAIDKAKATLSIVGYSDELLDDKKLTEYYNELNLNNGEDYLTTILKIRKFNQIKSQISFKKPFNKTDWTTLEQSFIEVNAYNKITSNMIIILSGILHDIVFHIDRSTYLNYGAVGAIIGHELFHSFDNKGSQFDKDGNIYDWWTANSKETFKNKSQCFIDQYSKYKIDEIDENVRQVFTNTIYYLTSWVDGRLSLGENIADGSGIRIAYLAYKDWVATHGSETHLPELTYTTNQLFWISMGNVWCDIDSRESIIEKIILRDPHPPHNWRVRGALSNIPEFSDDFNCPIDSKMNPKIKCTLW